MSLCSSKLVLYCRSLCAISIFPSTGVLDHIDMLWLTDNLALRFHDLFPTLVQRYLLVVIGTMLSSTLLLPSCTLSS